MEVDLVLALAVAGTMLGVVEGLKPGPLMTMVVRETLSGGLKAGMWTAAAPIFTDGPLILLSVLVAASVCLWDDLVTDNVEHCASRKCQAPRQKWFGKRNNRRT